MRLHHDLRRARTLVPSILVLMTVGCGGGGSTDRAQSDAPGASFRSLEERLLAARDVRLPFHVTAEGAVEADLTGSLRIGPDRETRLSATGRFAGRAVDLLLRARDDSCTLSDGTRDTTVVRPARLEEAILVGLTRMGILHNLSRLADLEPPDHADGGVRDWVVADSFEVDARNPRSTSFDLTVSGRPSGSALLEVDGSGLPLVRRQTVHFAAADMYVVERYVGVSIEP